MALISNFPTFTGSTRPVVADLRTAFRKIVEVLGGVYDGISYPASLNAANHVAAPAFRNDQKSDPSSIFSLPTFCPIPTTVDGVITSHAVVPVACRIKGVLFGDGVPGQTNSLPGSGVPRSGYYQLKDHGTGLILAREDYTEVAFQKYEYASLALDLAVPAGTCLELEVCTIYGNQYASHQHNALIFCQAEHVP